MSLSEQLRYEGRQEGLKAGLQKGLQEGRQEGRQEGLEQVFAIAERLLADGMGLAAVAKITGLSMASINKYVSVRQIHHDKLNRS